MLMDVPSESYQDKDALLLAHLATKDKEWQSRLVEYARDKVNNGMFVVQFHYWLPYANCCAHSSSRNLSVLIRFDDVTLFTNLELVEISLKKCQGQDIVREKVVKQWRLEPKGIYSS